MIEGLLYIALFLSVGYVILSHTANVIKIRKYSTIYERLDVFEMDRKFKELKGYKDYPENGTTYQNMTRVMDGIKEYDNKNFIAQLKVKDVVYSDVYPYEYTGAYFLSGTLGEDRKVILEVSKLKADLINTKSLVDVKFTTKIKYSTVRMEVDIKIENIELHELVNIDV